MKASVVLLLFTLLCSSGCIALKVDEAKLASIHRRGLATLEPSAQDLKASLSGPRLRRFYAAWVDAPVQKLGGFNLVAELAPGERRVLLAAYVQDPRFGGFDLATASVEATLHTEPGHRYRVEGKCWGDSVQLWVVDTVTSARVTEIFEAKLTLQQHRAPIIIPVPI